MKPTQARNLNLELLRLQGDEHNAVHAQLEIANMLNRDVEVRLDILQRAQDVRRHKKSKSSGSLGRYRK